MQATANFIDIVVSVSPGSPQRSTNGRVRINAHMAWPRRWRQQLAICIGAQTRNILSSTIIATLQRARWRTVPVPRNSGVPNGKTAMYHACHSHSVESLIPLLLFIFSVVE